jgi:cobalt-zinc-cadmium efflux system membrane fusion protein
MVLLAACGQADPPGSSTAPSADDTGNTQSLVRVQGNLPVETFIARSAIADVVRSIPGEAYPAPEHFAVVSAPIGGRVARVAAHEGEAVRKGQVVLELESIGFADMVAAYLEARADEAFYRTQEERVAMLVERKISPQAALDRASAERQRADARVSSTFGRLRALDLPASVIDALQNETRDRPLLPVYAPISGVIDQHNIDLGTSVSEYQELLTIVNPAWVMVRAFADPEDARPIRPGTPVRIARRTSGGDELEATVTSVSPALDAENRSVALNILLATRDGFPVPGQSVRIEVTTPSDEPLFRVPTEGLLYDGDQPAVFVRRSADTFELVPVELERVTETHAYIRSGLTDGDEVAVTEVFSLKALVRYGEYAED